MSRSPSPLSSNKPLGGRYRIVQQLGVGGFGRTFLAADLHLPGHPQCVIKHLRPQVKSEDTLLMARRCFNTEAEVLYQLGVHDQIPRLLAHFEESQEFYLAQEFVEGEPIAQELVEGKPWSQAKTLAFLKEVLFVLQFVHEQQVIHRDLKPSNLIRRNRDQKLVLIDFGAVKQVSNQSFDTDSGHTNLTISIGTQGYMPSEQLAGKPRFSSDVFAVGVLGIQALTGLHPRYLGEDEGGEINWHSLAPQTHPALVEVIDRMVRYDFRARYSTAAEALAALNDLPSEIAEDTTEPPLTAVPATLRQKTTAKSAGNSAGHSAGHSAGNGAALRSTGSQSANSKLEAKPAELSTEQGNLQTLADDTAGIDVTVMGEDSLATALWIPSESLSESLADAVPLQTGATQLLGRLHSPSQAGTPTVSQPLSASASWSSQRRKSQPWVILGAAAAIGLSLVALQARFPLALNHWLDRDTASSTTTKPSPGSSPLPTDPKQLASVLVTQAAQLQSRQAYKEALEYFDRAIAAKSDFADAYTGRCEVLNLLKRPEEAIVSCNDALAYEPDNPVALWSKGNALMQQNRTYEALKLYEDVTYLKPDFASGWVRRGVALQKLGRSAEALNALDRGIDIQRNSAEAWITKGAALLNLQRYNDAVAALDKALQLQPNSEQARELRQQARERLGR
ncbi:protein kinase domain-containing protein [Leptolyngbya ohadii]|uniref:serine/threonine-protein kinase n=1 Tax=Leptolyngbya ohadii TaxID=1962290 RepID=UPI00117AB4CC|nr:serine/threonine-protein kinase [Leptolyngbya ohadii]